MKDQKHSDTIFYQVKVFTPVVTYPIYIGENIDTCYNGFLERYPRFAILTNNTFGNLYETFLNGMLDMFPQSFPVVISDGEEYKNSETLHAVYRELISRRLGRDGLVVGLGGGVIGDLAGFAAATYMRGIDYAQIPTTLLAMVDSSVGGKTAINLPEGKNLVGAYHQPQSVFCDLRFLDTLPQREFHAGLMEVIKYGLILDAQFYDYLIQNKEDIEKRKRSIIAYIICCCCQLKAEIVTQDEKEQGMRSILNFGHTIAHALESYTHYSFYLHGEAVSIGSLAIMQYLVDEGILDYHILNDFTQLLTFFQLPCSLPVEFDIEGIVEQVAYDKKNRNGRNQWVTLKKIGVPLWGKDVDLDLIKTILRGLQRHGQKENSNYQWPKPQ